MNFMTVTEEHWLAMILSNGRKGNLSQSRTSSDSKTRLIHVSNIAEICLPEFPFSKPICQTDHNSRIPITCLG
jgi:hypothetical protein